MIFELTVDIKLKIKQHAIANPKKEVCGIVIEDSVIEGENIHSEPKLHFHLDDDTYTTLLNKNSEGVPSALYHSHVDDFNYYFSMNDALKIQTMLIPWILYHVKSDSFHLYNPTLLRPYVDRHWNYLFDNCYTLVKEWMMREMDIHLNHYQLVEGNPWERYGWNEFEENIEKEGFVLIGSPFENELEYGDFILMKIGYSQVSNHIGVYLHNLNFLNHFQDRDSAIYKYTNKFKKSTTGVWRHGSLISKDSNDQSLVA